MIFRVKDILVISQMFDSFHEPRGYITHAKKMYLPMSVYEHPQGGCRFLRSRSTCRYSSLSRRVKVSLCIDTENGSQNSYTTSSNGIASQGAPVRDILGFCQPHVQGKKNASTIFALCDVSCVFIFAPTPTTHAETKTN